MSSVLNFHYSVAQLVIEQSRVASVLCQLSDDLSRSVKARSKLSEHSLVVSLCLHHTFMPSPPTLLAH